MSTSSVDETKTGPTHSAPNASSCCGANASTDAGEQTLAHGSCATHEGAAAHATTAAAAGDQGHPASSAGHHRKKAGCCGGS